MAEPPKKSAPAKQAEFDIDFNKVLPPWEFFTCWWLAKFWRCSVEHVIGLVESGELKVGMDLRGQATTKTMIRVPRLSVLEFMNARKDMAAVAAKNPAYKARKDFK